MQRSIAWIEDDTHIIAPVVRPLEKMGCIFSQFHTAQAALDGAEHICRHNLLLLDIIIPTGNAELRLGRFPGIGVLRRLRENWGLQIPVVVLTVVGRETVVEALDDLRVDEILTKPVLPSELQGAVARILTPKGA